MISNKIKIDKKETSILMQLIVNSQYIDCIVYTIPI